MWFKKKAKAAPAPTRIPESADEVMWAGFQGGPEGRLQLYVAHHGGDWKDYVKAWGLLADLPYETYPHWNLYDNARRILSGPPEPA